MRLTKKVKAKIAERLTQMSDDDEKLAYLSCEKLAAIKLQAQCRFDSREWNQYVVIINYIAAVNIYFLMLWLNFIADAIIEGAKQGG